MADQTANFTSPEHPCRLSRDKAEWPVSGLVWPCSPCLVLRLRCWLAQFHGQDGLGDAPLVHPALESISHSPLQGFAALKLVEVRPLGCQQPLLSAPEIPGPEQSREQCCNINSRRLPGGCGSEPLKNMYWAAYRIRCPLWDPQHHIHVACTGL